MPTIGGSPTVQVNLPVPTPVPSPKRQPAPQAPPQPVPAAAQPTLAPVPGGVGPQVRPEPELRAVVLPWKAAPRALPKRQLRRAGQPARKMMGEREAFEHAIDRDPTDATAHHVYADWLEENGPTEEAAFRRAMGNWVQKRPRIRSTGESGFSLGRTHPWWTWSGDYPEGSGSLLTTDLNQFSGVGSHPTDHDPTTGVIYGRGIHWLTYRGMEEAFRRAFHANRPQQLSRLPRRRLRRIPMPVKNARSQVGTPLHKKLLSLRPEFAKAAQEVYDAWDASDEEFGDPDVGFGGICQDIACALSGVMDRHGIDGFELNAQTGDQHVWMAAHDGKNMYHVDIPPHVYETGGGYSWQKIPGVQFQPDHVTIDPEANPEDFRNEDGELQSPDY